MSYGPFSNFIGREIKIELPHFYGYVPFADEREALEEEAIETLHPEEMLEDGFTIIAISGLREDGEMVQMDGFLAINIEDGSFYICDEGSIIPQDGDFTDLDIELDD